MCRDFGGPRDSRAMRLYMKDVSKVSHHPAKLACNRHCDSGDNIILVCHVISQDHVIIFSICLYGGSPS